MIHANLIGGTERVAYTVEHRDGCILVSGNVPLSDFSVLVKLAPKDSVVDPDLARMFGANLAFGLPDDIAPLKQKVAEGVFKRERAAHPALSDSAVRWLASGERGVSSETMFSVLTGVKIRESHDWSVPWDSDDFRRCRLLLEQVPELEPYLHKMSGVSLAWANLVRDWTKICLTMDQETPNWRKGSVRAHETYKLIKQATRL